ncbi:MAG: ABC transporter ATP-binding protein [Bacteroidota bacterium]
MNTPTIVVSNISHEYAGRPALNNVSLEVSKGEVFGFLGPNGGGKTTMFKILSTAIVPTNGRAEICGYDVVANSSNVRKHIGVVFQSPSLDIKLTVKENLRFQGLLHGMYGSEAMKRIDDVLRHLKLEDRKHDIVEQLSGGLQRRVEIGKGLLHMPNVLILDEPSTGLDPGARRDLWDYLLQLRSETGITVVITSHILEEAEHCDRLAILDKGSLVALGTPDTLKREVGGEVISIVAKNPDELRGMLKKKFKLESTIVDGTLRVEKEKGHQFVPRIVEAFPGKISAVSVGKPTLEDVFIHRTGHKMVNDIPNEAGK